MPKPRYDEDENVSRHAAVDESCCEEMEHKYGWNLERVEQISSAGFFKVDCVFEGDTDFPKSFHEEGEE